MASRIVSGIQPTGVPHLGNYLGAIRQWRALGEQADGGAWFGTFIADLHALTNASKAGDAATLQQQCRETAAALVACGLREGGVFRQSAVPEHTELAWVLTCHTPLGWLNRMTQFKAKSGGARDKAVLGLFSYPVLMAADILLYQATDVPVGDDQKQHLELTASIANAFNAATGTDVFPVPRPLFVDDAGVRVMSLRDGTKKMSKSDASDASRINLNDTADAIRKKVRKAKTDSLPGLEYDRETRPDRSNLIALLSILTNSPIEAVVRENQSRSAVEFKDVLADAIIAEVCPIGDEIDRRLADATHLDDIMRKGAEEARAHAAVTMQAVREATGLASPVELL